MNAIDRIDCVSEMCIRDSLYVWHDDEALLDELLGGAERLHSIGEKVLGVGVYL